MNLAWMKAPYSVTITHWDYNYLTAFLKNNQSLIVVRHKTFIKITFHFIFNNLKAVVS